MDILRQKKWKLFQSDTIPEIDYLESKLKHDLAELEVEQEEAEVEETERNLDLSRIRVKQEIAKEK